MAPSCTLGVFPKGHNRTRANPQKVAVARISALARAAQRSVNPPKTYPTKVRGSKARVQLSKPAKADDAVELD
jgi:large subunit ribosomal protein L28e